VYPIIYKCGLGVNGYCIVNKTGNLFRTDNKMQRSSSGAEVNLPEINSN
jgi:hypothetical protein